MVRSSFVKGVSRCLLKIIFVIDIIVTMLSIKHFIKGAGDLVRISYCVVGMAK